jgi:hypothetical protein
MHYDLPGSSDQVGTLYEHCTRAIRNGLKVGVLFGPGEDRTAPPDTRSQHSAGSLP